MLSLQRESARLCDSNAVEVRHVCVCVFFYSQRGLPMVAASVVFNLSAAIVRKCHLIVFPLCAAKCCGQRGVPALGGFDSRLLEKLT